MSESKGPKALVYGRVDCPDAFALRVQQEALISYAEKKCYKVVGVVVEHGSGATMNWRGLNEVSTAARQGMMDVLLVKDMSRLGRNTQDVLDYIDWLEQNGVDVICMDGDGPVKEVAEITRHILTAVATQSMTAEAQ